MTPTTTDGRTWIPAPQLVPGSYQTGDVTGVWVRPGEEVDWIYFNSRVVGYTIVKKSNAQFVRKVKP